MRRISVLGAALLVSLLLGVRADESYPAPTVKVASGNLAAYIESFVEDIPGKYSKAYDVPTASERSTMAAAYDAIEAGDLSGAASLVDSHEYDVVQYEDTATGQTLVVLSERQNQDGSWPHAWGMYVFSPAATSDTTVEVTHPVADWNTEDVGVEVFRKANAEDLFIAGAHRYANCDGPDVPCEWPNLDRAADVAHAAESVWSVFEDIHKAAIESPTDVFQPHGFSQTDHPQCGEVFVSAGTTPASLLAQKVHGALQNAGFDTRLYKVNEDGTIECPELGATKNVQGASTRAIGADFLHVEMNGSIRNPDDPNYYPTLTPLVASTISDALLPPTVTSPRPAPGSSTRDHTPTVRATVRDAHTNLAKSSIRLSVDGRRVTTFAYNRATHRLTYTTRRELSPGRHKVEVKATDAAGNVATKRWGFKVIR